MNLDIKNPLEYKMAFNKLLLMNSHQMPTKNGRSLFEKPIKKKSL